MTSPKNTSGDAVEILRVLELPIEHGRQVNAPALQNCFPGRGFITEVELKISCDSHS